MLNSRLKKLQELMIQGGSKAGDKDLKEKRKLKKKAAESRLKVLGEALGHVDDEDGVLVGVLVRGSTLEIVPNKTLSYLSYRFIYVTYFF